MIDASVDNADQTNWSTATPPLELPKLSTTPHKPYLGAWSIAVEVCPCAKYLSGAICQFLVYEPTTAEWCEGLHGQEAECEGDG